MGLLSAVAISDVPENKANKLKATAVVGQVEQKEVANDYISVAVPLEFTDEVSGDSRTFTARWNVKADWFNPGFSVAELEDKEKISYQINMQKLTRGLFKSAGLESIDFDQIVGETVGFTAGPRKDDPSRLEVKGFYTPKA